MTQTRPGTGIRRSISLLRWIIVITVMLAVALALIVQFSAPIPVLSRIAHRVVQMPSNLAALEDEGYANVDDRHVLLYPTARLNDCRLLDTFSGLSSPVRTRGFGHNSGYLYGYAYSQAKSRLLWLCDKNSRTSICTFSLVPDSGGDTDCDLKDVYFFSNVIWLGSGEQFAWLNYGEKQLSVTVVSRESGSIERQVALDYPKCTTDGHDFIHPTLLGEQSNGRILAVGGEQSVTGIPKSERSIKLFEFNTRSPKADLREYSIMVPADGSGQSSRSLGQHEEVLLSPKGDRLAWLLLCKAPPNPLLAVAGRFVPRLRRNSRPKFEIRVSRTDGTDMRTIATAEFRAPYYVNDRVGPCGLRWCRDSGALTVVWQGSLWRLDVK